MATTISKAAAKILEKVTAGLAVGEARKFGEKGGAFMQLSVERLTGNTFTLAHYFEQNGDLVPDPDMVFWRSPSTGAWMPVSIQQAMGNYTRALELEGDEPARYSPRALRDLCSFAAMWMRNLKFQQGL